MIARSLILISLLLFISGCATLPPPVSQDRYKEILGAPNVGLKVIDGRQDDIVGTVGLASLKMKSLDSFFYSELRNELNNIGGLNVTTYTGLSDSKDLRIPLVIISTIQSAYFSSFDALMDDADGKCSVLVQVKDAAGKLILSDTYTSSYKRKVSWPNMNGNKVIIEELLKRVTTQIVLSPKIKDILAY
tara:strand:+ start:699 stop:1265 length:567 start_codon:yes stop_codon:yes gene_type:complete